MINFKQMMQQAQQMQFKLQEVQEKLKEISVQGESGGGLVKITMNCAGVTDSVSIDPSLIKADDKETLEDLIVLAMNATNEIKETKIRTETEKMMAQLGLPKDTKLPF